MACGEYGEGKMSDPLDVFNTINTFLFNQLNNNKIKSTCDSRSN